MLTSKGKVFKMEEYQKDVCEVYDMQIEKVLKDRYPTKVVQVHKRLDPNKKWAVKMCYKDKTQKGISAERQFLTEVGLLAELKHPFIMCLDTVASFPNYFCFVMPFYEQGTLTKALPTMTHELRDECLVQLCCGIKFLHDRGVAHRDLKSDNILLTNQKNVVIADFGLADHVWPSEPLVTGRKGTVMHISPEQDNKTFDCFKCDMYSLGVVYWCMLCMVDVIDMKPKEPLLTIVLRTFFLPDIDRDILSCLLEADPTKRFSVLSLINLLNRSIRFKHRIEMLRDIGLL
ncbi:CBL-interacting serine/threonine-protein kinase 16 [Biomphalaria glabrata]|nr:CBL-interacting serine/threonine-protein kinase 16 [Biomphalaria glabrata]